MSKSATGSTNAPGKKALKTKSVPNKSILHPKATQLILA